MSQVSSKNKKQPKIVTQIDDFGRKKFKLQQNSSQENEQDEQKFIDTGKHTSTLIGRDEKIDISKYIGKIQGNNKKRKKTQVFYCQVCQIGFKCDLAYITHVNSVSHNRKLGMNMKVEAVPIQTVTQKLARMAEQKNKSKQQKIMQKKLGKNWQAHIKNIQKQQEGKQQKQLKKQQIKQAQAQAQNNLSINTNKDNITKLQIQKQKAEIIQNGHKKQVQVQDEQEQQDQDQKMMKNLGLPTSFGSKKKKY